MPPTTAPVPEPADKPTLTLAEAAKILGVSRTTAYEAVHSGEIPSIRIGRRILVPTAALRRLLLLDEAGLIPSDEALDLLVAETSHWLRESRSAVGVAGYNPRNQVAERHVENLLTTVEMFRGATP